MVTEKIVILPNNIEKKEEQGLQELFQAEIIKTRLAESSLIGILAIGNSSGIVVSGIVEQKEVEELEKKGLRVKRLSTVNAIGNLAEVNDSKGFCSKVLPEKTKKEIEDFLGIEMNHTNVAETEVVGASIVLTNKGFIVNPNIKNKQFGEIRKWTALEGKATTANLGDIFVGNSVIANSKGAAVGLFTTPQEIIRIDDGLGGEQ